MLKRRIERLEGTPMTGHGGLVIAVNHDADREAVERLIADRDGVNPADFGLVVHVQRFIADPSLPKVLARW